MNGHIYLIRNLINGKGYVGQTTASAAKRFIGHKHHAVKRGCNYYLHKAIRKYGIKNFSLTKIVTCDQSLLNELEKFCIVFYGTSAAKGHGYNMTEGGKALRGYKHTEEAKAKISAVHKGKIVSSETRKKLSGPKSPEHVAKVVAAKKFKRENRGIK